MARRAALLNVAFSTPSISIVQIAIFLNLYRPYPGFLSEGVAFQIGGRIFDFLVVALCILVILSTGKVCYRNENMRALFVFSAVLCIYSIFALVNGLIVFEYVLSGRDLFEPFRFILIFIVAYTAYISPSINHEFWTRFWRLNVLLFAFVVVVYLLSLPGLIVLVEMLFGASKQKFVQEAWLFRQTGYFVNPNWAALFLNYALAFFIMNLDLRRFSNVLMIVLTLALILISGSRTGLICCMFVLLYSITFPFSIKSWLAVILTAAIAVFVVDVELLLPWFPNHQRELIRALVESGSLAGVGTFSDRMDLWTLYIGGFFETSPFIGHGSFKFATLATADNQYVKWLVWYGILGLLMHLLFYISTLLVVLMAAGREDSALSSLSKSITLSILVTLLAGITGSFLDVTQISFILFFMIGSLIRMAERNPNRGKFFNPFLLVARV